MAKDSFNSPATQAMTEIKRLSENGMLASGRNHFRDALEASSIAATSLKNSCDLRSGPDYQNLRDNLTLHRQADITPAQMAKDFSNSPAAQAMADVKRVSESGTFANARSHLRDALETSSIAASSLKNMGDLLQTPDYSNLLWDNYHYEPPPVLDIPPNPIHETNRQLAELKEQIGALIALSREQAKLTEAIHEANKAALELAAQSAAESKASTALATTSIELTRKGVHIATWALGVTVITALLSILANIFVPIYLDRSHHPASTPIPAAASETPQSSIQEKRPPAGHPVPQTQAH